MKEEDMLKLRDLKFDEKGSCPHIVKGVK